MRQSPLPGYRVPPFLARGGRGVVAPRSPQGANFRRCHLLHAHARSQITPEWQVPTVLIPWVPQRRRSGERASLQPWYAGGRSRAVAPSKHWGGDAQRRDVATCPRAPGPPLLGLLHQLRRGDVPTGTRAGEMPAGENAAATCRGSTGLRRGVGRFHAALLADRLLRPRMCGRAALSGRWDEHAKVGPTNVRASLSQAGRWGVRETCCRCPGECSPAVDKREGHSGRLGDAQFRHVAGR